MGQFQYRLYELSKYDESDGGLKENKNFSIEAFVDGLNELGKEGWQMRALFQPTNRIAAILMRETPPPPPEPAGDGG